MERNGDDLDIGGAPQVDLARARGCFASDGAQFWFAGGASESDGAVADTRGLVRVGGDDDGVQWRVLGVDLETAAPDMVGVRVGSQLWCLGGRLQVEREGVGGGKALLPTIRSSMGAH